MLKQPYVSSPSPDLVKNASYAEDMIAGQMIAGLANVEHQGKILAEATSLTTLKAKFNKSVSLETTDQAMSHLHYPPTPTAPAARSETAAQKHKSLSIVSRSNKESPT